MRRLIASALALMATTPALATTARVAGLSGNSAFTDDTDVFKFPSVISDTGDAVNLNYTGPNTVDGGVSWMGQHMLWLQRDSALPDGTGLGDGSPFTMTYGQGDGSTGFLARASWAPETFSLGGAWSKGGQARETSNFAAGGDIVSAKAGNSTKYAITAFAQSRDLTADSHTTWDATVAIQQDVSNVVRANYRMGPRWGDGQLRAALSIGPGLQFTNTKGGNAVALDVPAANLAAEYELREWLVIRGSSTVGLQLAVADVSKFGDTREFIAGSGGALGAGLKHGDKARFDMSIRPAWLVNGPAVLSGTPNPMFATVSGRILL